MTMKGVDLDKGPLEWEGVSCDFRERSLLFAWSAETSLANVVYMRYVSVHLGWPVFRTLGALFNLDEDETEDEPGGDP